MPSIPAKVDVQILKVDENKHCVRFTYKHAETNRDINKARPVIQHFISVRDSAKLRMFNDITFDEPVASE